MREQILNFFEKTDELFFQKVPYQIYLFGAFVSLLIVVGSIYSYTHPDPNVQNLIGLKEMQDELFNNELPCPRYDSDGVRIVCGGESYMIEEQTYGYGSNKFVYHKENN